MTSKHGRIAILALLLLTLGGTQAFAQGLPIYNNIPTPLPGNLVSQAFEAQSASEFGDRVAFTTGGRALTSVSVTMSSWGCTSGHWFSSDCVTTPGATFTHPITLNIYNVGPGNQPGALLATMTQTQTIPYRPSADLINCTAGRWFDASSSTCFNGKAANISFDFTSQHVVLPNQVIIGVAFNTSDYGYAKIGPTPCSTNPSGPGCPYDSLNVGVADPATTLSTGINPAPDDAYFNSLVSFFYCDGGVGGTGFFRLDPGAGCWTGFKPAVKVNAANPPLTKNDCKNGGWQTRTTASGKPFKNQGQCIDFVEDQKDKKDNDDKDKKDNDDKDKKDKDDKGDKHDH